MTKRILTGCHAVPLGIVNTYLLETSGGLALVDTGFPGREHALLAAMRRLGYAPRDLKHIVLTHAHPDHVGSAAALVRATGAQTWMHREDIAVAERRTPMRSIHPSEGLLPKLLLGAMTRGGPPTWEAVGIDNALVDGDVLPFGSIRVIHAPGHCAGQIALLWSERSLLIAADACMHLLSLRAPLVNEDEALGRSSLLRLAQERFDTAVFGHGRALKSEADARFRAAFTSR